MKPTLNIVVICLLTYMLQACQTVRMEPLRTAPPRNFIVVLAPLTITQDQTAREYGDASVYFRKSYSYLLPKGQYRVISECPRGYFFAAPDNHIVTRSGEELRGGIFWRKGYNKPKEIFFSSSKEVGADVSIEMFPELSSEIAIPPKVMTPEWSRFLGVDSDRNY